LAEAVSQVPGWMPEFDLALLRAGEHSGRLDVAFQQLANHYGDRAQLARQVLGDLAYPVFLLHFAVFILPFAQFFASGNLLVYLVQTFGVLLPIYGLTLFLIVAAQSRHGEAWRSFYEGFLRPVPVLGKARHSLALARLSGALEALLSAGVTIIEAWEHAAAASGSPALRRTVTAWKPNLLAGQTPSEMVNSSPLFPEVFAGQYAAGEISGTLDETLGRLHTYYLEEGGRKLRAFAMWTPKLFYLAIALVIAWKVVSFWSGYFKQVQDAGGF
jgi:type IV pilus assembly protein PilC